jgi:thymidylate synthase
MRITTIEATTIEDAWFQVIWGLVSNPQRHNLYTITNGSYVGSKRLEYDFVVVNIEKPYEWPMIPQMPDGLPPPTDMAYVEDYFANYLMDPILQPNETYKYASWLAPGVARVIEQLRGSSGNNQACISVGGLAPDDNERVVDTDNMIDPATNERDPACLRVVDFRLDQNNNLHMITAWRSWSAWGGFPSNLAGLQYLNAYVAQEIGAEVGTMVATSKGLHLYESEFPVATMRCNVNYNRFIAALRGPTKPKRRMDNDESRRFWKAVDEIGKR